MTESTVNSGGIPASTSAIGPGNALTSATRLALRLLTRHRELTWEMTKREIGDRYAGQFLGPIWVIGHPLLLMALYVFLFAYVFPARVGTSGPAGLSTYILSGLIPWMAFSESLAKGSSVLVSTAGLVRQVVFPLEVLPVKSVLASFVTQLVATVLLLAYNLVVGMPIKLIVLSLPLLFVLQLLAMCGTCYLLSAVGAYFRDLKDVVQVFLNAGLFLAPILYVPEVLARLPRPLTAALAFNPFSHLVWCYQDAIYFGRFAHPTSWAIFALLSILVFAAGFKVFEKLKHLFGDIL